MRKIIKPAQKSDGVKENKILKTMAAILVLFTIIAVFLLIITAVPVSRAQGPELGINYARNLDLPSTDGDIRVTILNIVRYFLTFVGIIAVIMIMYSGFLWMTSGGNQEKIERAKKALVRAGVGLVIIVLAFAIVTFVINFMEDALTGGLGGGGGPGSPGPGIGAIGNCGIESVYPEPGQTDVPRNTALIVTFTEEVDPTTVCDDVGGNIDGDCDPGEYIIADYVRLFINNDGDACEPPGDCTGNVLEINAATTDSRTFVFSPANYLGSPSEHIWYQVILTSGIQKLNQPESIFADCSFTDSFSWRFEVSNEIDLTPPRVLSSGVFPFPDDEADTETPIPATAATGMIAVNSLPSTRVFASVIDVTPEGAWPDAQATIETTCAANALHVTVISDTSAQLRLNNASGALLGAGNITSANTVSFSYCNLVLTMNSGDFAADCAGNCLWLVEINAYVAPDNLQVGNTNYIFVSGTAGTNEIQAGINTANTANNIAASLAGHSQVTAAVIATGNVVELTAIVAGSAGNNINLSTSDTTAIGITPMSGGVDGGVTVTINDRRDQPRNAVIQINFNEAINPITVSGDAVDVSPFLRVIDIDGAVVAPGDFLAGKFVLSNQYRTVEFISNNLCGVNGCGEQIYCLPGDSHLRVELQAASLAPCPGQIDCTTKTPYIQCNGNICQNSALENYPLSASPLDGIADMALNSLDGDRSEEAEGPLAYYDENTETGAGDNYQWSFWLSNIIDISAPIINSLNPGHTGDNASLADPITIRFNKIMMSSSLRPGSTRIYNGQEYFIHKLINLWNFSNQPTGYWLAKENIDTSAPLDGEPDITVAEIRHSLLADTTSYRAQAGSGVKDIYQNCFKPVTGPGCSGTASQPSCCPAGGVGDVLAPTGVLSGEGNCP